MRRTIFSALLISFSLTTFCQYRKGLITPVTTEDYRLISKREKTAAWLLFGAGSTMILGASLISTRKDSSYGHPETAVVLGGVGVLSVSASIPFFILSGKNKKRATRL